MKKAFLILSLSLFNLLVFSQTPKDQISVFFESFEKKGFNSALDTLFSSNKWADNLIDAKNNVKAQYAATSSLMGEYSGYEKLTTQKVGNSLEYYTYIVKFSRQPLRFHFMFYKAKDKWEFYKFKYEDNLASEFETGSSLFMMQYLEKDKEE